MMHNGRASPYRPDRANYFLSRRFTLSRTCGTILARAVFSDGVDLNCSESRRRTACPSMMPAQAPDLTYSGQASAEHFEQSAEFALLRNRRLGPIAVTVLSIPLARRAAATVCAAV